MHARCNPSIEHTITVRPPPLNKSQNRLKKQGCYICKITVGLLVRVAPSVYPDLLSSRMSVSPFMLTAVAINRPTCAGLCVHHHLRIPAEKQKLFKKYTEKILEHSHTRAKVSPKAHKFKEHYLLKWQKDLGKTCKDLPVKDEWYLGFPWREL
jgi:hypothetical protein